MAKPTTLEKALIALGRPTGNGIDAPDYRLLELPLIDHVIIGATCWYSMRAEGAVMF